MAAGGCGGGNSCSGPVAGGSCYGGNGVGDGLDAEEDAGVTGEKVKWAWSSRRKTRVMDDDAGTISIDLVLALTERYVQIVRA